MTATKEKPRARRPVRTRPVLQMEEVECGAAALTMVLAHHGRYVPLEEMRLACGVSRDGSRASDLVKAAREYGLEAKGFRAEPETLGTLPTPAILFWEFNHFVVYEGTGTRFGRPAVFLNDPATGRRTVTPEEFDAAFTGVVLTFTPGEGFTAGGRRATALTGLRDRLGGTRTSLVLAVLTSLLLILGGVAMASFTRSFVDSVLAGTHTDSAAPLFVAMIAAILAVGALTAVQQGSLARIYLVAATFSQARFLYHLLRLPIRFFAQRSPAELTRRLETNNAIAQILARDVVATAVNAVVVVVYAALMWFYDPELTLIGVGAALLNIAVLRVAMRLRESSVAKLRADRAKFWAVSFDGLQQIETLKATGGESSHFARWAGHHAALMDTEQRVGVSGALLATVAPLLSVVNSALLLLVGGLRALDGHVSIGLIVAFQSLSAGFVKPVGELSSVAGRVQDFGQDVARLRDVEDFQPDPSFDIPEPEVIRQLAGHLEVDAVTFGFSTRGAALLSDFSFTVRPGQQVALVGGSGSGKSTVSRLVAGLYQPWSGAIRFDGRPREEIPRSVLAASVALVDQDVFLFEGTVRDNVTLWDPSIPDEAVIAALRDAELYDSVSRRPGGIHARVEEGGRNFSGGQRQRLELARALVRDPSVLILDEATSALDAETELRIADHLRRRGCACVVIAHRLSTVRDSNEIIVLDRGRVVERGTHTHLIAAGGAYAELVRNR
ncbi:NHLP family bacteriocin export ABC transporter peptidase/permease/ATPase subunit [Kitasatospora sp. NPDC093102]|uniref:NHLP family bacteriocin export ABC transporter peptidase/permease/ATPase subunit n=1 Tax=Kitasatospora sp. NPDC093102 TaxID=3155069 RepID=UPI00341F7774